MVARASSRQVIIDEVQTPQYGRGRYAPVQSGSRVCLYIPPAGRRRFKSSRQQGIDATSSALAAGALLLAREHLHHATELLRVFKLLVN